MIIPQCSRVLRWDAKGCVGTQKAIALGCKGLLRWDAKGYCAGTQRAIALGRKGLILSHAEVVSFSTVMRARWRRTRLDWRLDHLTSHKFSTNRENNCKAVRRPYSAISTPPLHDVLTMPFSWMKKVEVLF